jgi:hypothetical protein
MIGQRRMNREDATEKRQYWAAPREGGRHLAVAKRALRRAAARSLYAMTPVEELNMNLEQLQALLLLRTKSPNGEPKAKPKRESLS